MTQPLFEPNRGTYAPTELTTGPWGRDLMHGGAIAALGLTLLEQASDQAYRPLRVITRSCALCGGSRCTPPYVTCGPDAGCTTLRQNSTFK